jgi:hypothetical protein
MIQRDPFRDDFFYNNRKQIRILRRMKVFLLLLSWCIVTLAASTPARCEEIDLDFDTIIAVESIEDSGQPLLRVDVDPRLPFHFLADGAMAYGMFRIHPRHDKVKHLLGGYVISNVSTGLLHLYLPDDLKHRNLLVGLIGFGAGSLAGVAKELIDVQGYGTPSVKDAAATALGAGLGALTLNLTFDLKFNKSQKRRTL